MPEHETVCAKLSSSQIPQADRPELVVEVLSFIDQHGRRPKEGEGAFTNRQRQLDYACHAAILLDLLEEKLSLTDTGRILLTLDSDLRLLRLIFAFEASEVGQAWICWANARDLAEVKPESATEFLQSCADNADTDTAARRARTLRSWSQKFQDLRHRDAGPNLSFGNWTPLQRPAEDAFVERNVFVEVGSDRVLHRLAQGTYHLRVASGFFTISGYLRLVEPLSHTVVKLLIGEDDRNPFARRSERDAAVILMLFRASLGHGLLNTMRRQETKRLHRDLLRTVVKVRYFEPKKSKGLHAKVYLFDQRAAYVTSANLTLRGLQQNIEAGRVLSFDQERADIEHFVRRFDELFGEATALSGDVLRALEESWAFKRPVTPYQFFLKVMCELYDRLPRLTAEMKKPLADFQRRIVTPVISKLLTYRGAMLISPVGTGKTLMASYVAAYLKQERYVRRIVVVCPNDTIAEKWRAEMNLFDLTIDVVTHGVLRRKDEELSPENQQLLQQLRIPRSNRLIIVDECHHFRNDDTSGWKGIRSLLAPDKSAGDTRPYGLLLTATPLSVGRENVNALLELIGENEVKIIEEIDDRYAVVSVTLPFILTYYGVKQTGKRGRALRFGETYRYYPEVDTNTERYQSAMGHALQSIADLHLEFSVGAEEAVAATAMEDEQAIPARHAGFGPMLRKNLARRAESSPAALKESVQRLQSGINAGTIHPVQKELLLKQLDVLASCIPGPKGDTKLTHLLKLLRRRPPRKVLIFSEALATVRYLDEQLRLAFPHDQIRFLTGDTAQAERQEILLGFPSSISILISSNASSEGVDLPGAHLVVNYDLSWTPLILAQRSGRIDRPTLDLYKVEIKNFYPGSEHFDLLVGLWERLEGRAEMLKTLTTVRVIGEHSRPSAASSSGDIGFVRALYETGDYKVLERCLPTPPYLEAWLAAAPEQLRAAARLPDGVQCAQRANQDSCYVLVRYEDLTFALVRDRQTGELRQAPKGMSHELLVKECVFAEQLTPGIEPPAAFDDEVAAAVQIWAGGAGIEPDDVTIIASKYIER